LLWHLITRLVQRFIQMAFPILPLRFLTGRGNYLRLTRGSVAL
jgi:hypothetical protein